MSWIRLVLYWLSAPFLILWYSLTRTAASPVLHGPPQAASPAPAHSTRTEATVRAILLMVGMSIAVGVLMIIAAAILSGGEREPTNLDLILLGVLLTAGGVWAHVILSVRRHHDR